MEYTYGLFIELAYANCVIYSDKNLKNKYANDSCKKGIYGDNAS